MKAAREESVPQLDPSLCDIARLETFGRLAVGVSHDFKNLLQIVVGNLYLLESSVSTDPAALNRLQVARRAANRGSELIERLLALARPTGSTVGVIDASEVVRGLGTLLERALGRQIHLEVHASAEACAVRAEGGTLESVLVNLLINARDAMTDGGRIILTVENKVLDPAAAGRLSIRPGEYVVIQVIDNGQGIPAELLERVLDPFFTTKAKGHGSGLGLPMVQTFAQEAGGRLSLDSHFGRGTTVTLHVPRALDEAPKSLNDTALLPGLVKRRGRVIVADANEDVRHVLLGMLKTLGFDAVPVTSLAELPLALRRTGDATFLLLDESFAATSEAAERILTMVRKAAPEVNVVWLGSRGGVSALSNVASLTKPATRGALARALNVTADSVAEVPL